MNRWNDIAALFDAALEQPPSERTAWLQDACDDEQLRTEVERLLAAHERAGGILDTPPFVPPNILEHALEASVKGRHIGPYRLVRRIGRGGMGSVYLAERDDDQFTQRVAIKVLRKDLGSDDRVRRFLAERQILATLTHPNIARLYDGGVTDDGQPFFVMEYVDGQPIDRYCDAHQLPIKDRLRLFRVVCEAVQYAHRNLVVHRDLKPPNMLVTGEGQVKLLDFGIAKLLEPEPVHLQHPAPVTRTGMHLMTPAYASPEQVRGEPITTASDVYQLGIVLYELLTGHRPYHVGGHAPGDVERIICEEQPTRPSTVITQQEQRTTASGLETLTPEQVSHTRGTTTERLQKQLSGDLDTIVLMALRKEPERRYTSAEGLGQDLGRYLDQRPVQARPDTLGYRLRTFVRRHHWGVAAAVLFVLLLAGYAMTVTIQSERVQEALATARLEAETSEQVTDFMMEMFEAHDPSEALGDTITAEILLQRGVERADQLADQPEVQARLFDVVGRVYQSLGRFDEAQALLRRALDRRQALLGREHPDVAESMHHLAWLLYEKGNHQEAEVLYRDALAIRRAVLPDEHPDVAATLNDLGVLLWAEGDYEEARHYMEQALVLRYKLRDGDHPDVAESLHNLGVLLWSTGDYDAAEPFYRDALAMRRRLVGDDHPDVALTMSSLALLLKEQGAYADAEQLYRKALAMNRRLFGQNHPDVAITMNNLAVLLKEQGNLHDAERLYRESLAILQDVFGETHWRVASAMNNLAVLLKEQGNYAAAERFYREALAINRQRLGPEHPEVATMLNNLGVVLHEQGNPGQAETLHRQALAMRRTLLGPEHPDIAQSLHNLGKLLTEEGHYAEAAQCLQEALALERKLPGKERPTSLKALVTLYEAWGKPQRAAAYQAKLTARTGEEGL